MLIGGYFNILRYQEEKNNDRFDTHWPFLFNAVIDSSDLREVSMSGRQNSLGLITVMCRHTRSSIGYSWILNRS
uniref:Uncharacterized protein n=1 Tax=Aegilops tauschii subsp. strangulata TaxID=200361 RepID=A0A453KJ08_AEGTS